MQTRDDEQARAAPRNVPLRTCYVGVDCTKCVVVEGWVAGVLEGKRDKAQDFPGAVHGQGRASCNH